MTLHPALEAYLDALNPLVAQAAADGVVATPESARSALAGLNAYSLPRMHVAQVYDRVADLSHPVAVRVYVPRPGVESDVVLFVHGGGHMAGDLDVYDASARRTAVASGMVVVSVDYRRSPEAPFPEGLTDVYRTLHHLGDVLDDVATTGRTFGVADSGGAAKLASIAMRVASGEWTSPLERQVLLYPSLDYTMSGASLREFASGYLLSAERVQWYFDHYFPEGTDRRAASALYGAMNVDAPDTLVIAAEYDPLLSEAIEYVERLNAVGARAHLLIAPGMIHAFAFFETLIPEAIARLYEIVGSFLREGSVPDSW